MSWMDVTTELGSWILPTCSWPPTIGAFSYFISSMSFLAIQLLRRLRQIQLNQGHTCSFHPLKSASNQNPSFQKHPTVPDGTASVSNFLQVSVSPLRAPWRVHSVLFGSPWQTNLQVWGKATQLCTFVFAGRLAAND